MDAWFSSFVGLKMLTIFSLNIMNMQWFCYWFGPENSGIFWFIWTWIIDCTCTLHSCRNDSCKLFSIVLKLCYATGHILCTNCVQVYYNETPDLRPPQLPTKSGLRLGWSLVMSFTVHVFTGCGKVNLLVLWKSLW